MVIKEKRNLLLALTNGSFHSISVVDKRSNTTITTSIMAYAGKKNHFLNDFSSGYQLAGGITESVSLVARRNVTPISSIGQKDQDVHPIKVPQQQDSDSHPDTITMAPLTAVAVDCKVHGRKVNNEIVGGCQLEEKRGLKCVYTCAFLIICMQILYVERMWITAAVDLSRNKYEIVDNNCNI